MSSAYQVNQQASNATPNSESITGVVERLTFHSEESGYTVARLQRPKVSELTTITGSFAGIQPGQTLQLNGFWREHPNMVCSSKSPITKKPNQQRLRVLKST